MRRRRGTFQRRRQLWWMHPIVLFTLLMCFGSIATALAMRLLGIIP